MVVEAAMPRARDASATAATPRIRAKLREAVSQIVHDDKDVTLLWMLTPAGQGRSREDVCPGRATIPALTSRSTTRSTDFETRGCRL